MTAQTDDRVYTYYLYGSPEHKYTTPVAMYWQTRKGKTRGTELTLDEASLLAERLLGVVREVRADQS